MKYIRSLVLFLDDILVACALACFIVASYLVNAVLGTYILGAAFLVAAVFAGRALESLLPKQPQAPKKKDAAGLRIMRIRKKR